jgi:hypothetical protein
MKNLTDNELLALAWENIGKADKHLYSTVVLAIFVIIQALLSIFNTINFGFYIITVITSYILYFYHKRKQEKYMKVVNEVLDELTSRGI